MRRRFVLVIAFCVGVALLFAVVGQAAPQAATSHKAVRYDGRVTVLNKDAQSITLQAKSGVIEVKYSDQTKFTYRNKPGSIDDVKEGRRVVVLLDPNQKNMVALRVDVREGK